MFLHGTVAKEIDYLDIAKCSDSSPFGKAIYLTKDPLVADCYTGREGWIFEVELNGDWQNTINIDLPFYEQSYTVQRVIEKVAHLNDIKINPDKKTRYLIHPVYLNKERSNDLLRNNGFWMLYGKLDGMELSGLMDRGVQYAVLNNMNVSIIRAYDDYNQVVNSPFIETTI